MLFNNFGLENRLIWKGLYGDELYPSLSINSFIKDRNPFEDLGFRSCDGFFKASVNIANEYCKWCKDKHPSLNEEDLNDLFTFFIGTIGEVFMFLISVIHPTLYISEKKMNFTFSDLKFNEEDDYGVDLYGKVTFKGKTNSCVFQCKFWSPNSDKYITTTIVEKAYAEGVKRGYIKHNQTNNVVIFWLGDDSHVSNWCKQSPFYENAIFIDKKVLDYPDNIKNTNFWETLKVELTNIGNL